MTDMIGGVGQFGGHVRHNESTGNFISVRENLPAAHRLP